MIKSVFYSDHFQRLTPRLALTLDIANIAIIVLSLVLLNAAMSADNVYSDGEASLFIDQANQLVGSTYTTFGDSRLWPVHADVGGGVIVTDDFDQIKNRIGAGHYTVYLATQWLVFLFFVIAGIAALLLLASTSFLRLVAISAILLAATYCFGIPHLFTSDVGRSVSFEQQVMIFLVFAMTYWSVHKRLLKNTRTQDSLIAYASQSGSAMALARRFKKALSHGVDVRCFSTLTPECLTHYDQVLFIASTYGEGQPPEKARSFIRKLTALDAYTQPVQFSILALGDRQYQHFCAFGHQLNDLLRHKGAQSMLDMVEVDKLDASAIDSWWHKITALCHWQAGAIKQASVALTVTHNNCLNPSQHDRHAHVVQLDKLHLDYQPGDLLEIWPQRDAIQCRQILSELGFNEDEQVIFNKRPTRLLHAIKGLEWQGERADDAQQWVNMLKPIRSRVYSIASAPYQGEIDILVRRHQRADGRPGFASNYLCDIAQGQRVTAVIRKHPNFHLPEVDVPLILIGAGTGIAPLIGFLRHRAAMGSAQQHWLFFGEQYHTCDFYFADEISELQKQGSITHLDLAWSRDENPSYIGEHLERQQAQILEWVNDLGAYIYVCGNQKGFGESVCSILKGVLGQVLYDSMIQSGGLRTDLY